jgi:hypothetical protein
MTNNTRNPWHAARNKKLWRLTFFIDQLAKKLAARQLPMSALAAWVNVKAREEH